MGMSLGLSQSLSIAQTKNSGPSMCVIALADVSITGLDELREELSSFSTEVLKLLGTPYAGGTNARAYFDQNLKFLVEGLSSPPDQPDARYTISDSKLTLELLSNTPVKSPKERVEEQFDKSLIRAMATAVKEIDWIRGTLFKIYEFVMSAQKDYLLTNDPTRLIPLKMAEAGDYAGISLSSVSRFVANRSFLAPDGSAMPLRSMFVLAADPLRYKFYETYGPAIQRDAQLPFHEKIVDDFAALTGVKLARRTIGKYLLELANRRERVTSRKIRESVARDAEDN